INQIWILSDEEWNLVKVYITESEAIIHSNYEIAGCQIEVGNIVHKGKQIKREKSIRRYSSKHTTKKQWKQFSTQITNILKAQEERINLKQVLVNKLRNLIWKAINQAMKNNIKRIQTRQTSIKGTNKTDKKTAHIITALNKVIVIAKKYLLEKTDAKSMTRQVNKWIKVNNQIAKLLSIKLTDIPKGISLVHWFQEIYNLRTSIAKVFKLLLQYRKQAQIQKYIEIQQYNHQFTKKKIIDSLLNRKPTHIKMNK
ncbi:13960_t:CDS:1, partial [Acaulospora morrowiae]